MYYIFVWNIIKQRYDTTYIYDIYYMRTHVYVFHVFELSRWFRLVKARTLPVKMYAPQITLNKQMFFFNEKP